MQVRRSPKHNVHASISSWEHWRHKATARRRPGTRIGIFRPNPICSIAPYCASRRNRRSGSAWLCGTRSCQTAPEELWDRTERRLHCRLSRRRRWRVLDTSGVLHKAVKPMLRRGATSKWWIAEKRNALPETIELYHMAAEVLDWLRFHISELGRERATYQECHLSRRELSLGQFLPIARGALPLDHTRLTASSPATGAQHPARTPTDVH